MIGTEYPAQNILIVRTVLASRGGCKIKTSPFVTSQLGSALAILSAAAGHFPVAVPAASGQVAST